MPIYAAGPRPATMTLAPTSRRCIKHTLDRYLPLRSSTTKQRNSADPTPQIIARIASRPVSPDSSRAQISIAPARHRPTFPDRGFLPWRLSDAGRRCTWHRRVRPASETLHTRRHRPAHSITSSAVLLEELLRRGPAAVPAAGTPKYDAKARGFLRTHFLGKH